MNNPEKTRTRREFLARLAVARINIERAIRYLPQLEHRIVDERRILEALKYISLGLDIIGNLFDE